MAAAMSWARVTATESCSATSPRRPASGPHPRLSARAEHLHPAPVEDAVTAYRWLVDQANCRRTSALTGDSGRRRPGGDDTAGWLRDRGLPLPSASAPLSPWSDLARDRQVEIRRTRKRDHFVKRHLAANLSAVYLGDKGEFSGPARSARQSALCRLRRSAPALHSGRRRRDAARRRLPPRRGGPRRRGGRHLRGLARAAARGSSFSPGRRRRPMTRSPSWPGWLRRSVRPGTPPQPTLDARAGRLARAFFGRPSGLARGDVPKGFCRPAVARGGKRGSWPCSPGLKVQPKRSATLRWACLRAVCQTTSERGPAATSKRIPPGRLDGSAFCVPQGGVADRRGAKGGRRRSGVNAQPLLVEHGGLDGARYPALLAQPVAVAADGDHVAVVQQPVQDGGGHHGVAEHRAPFADRAVGGHQHAAALVAAARRAGRTDVRHWARTAGSRARRRSAAWAWRRS